MINASLEKTDSSRRKTFFSQVIDRAIDQGFSNSIPVSDKAKKRLIDEYCKQSVSFHGSDLKA